MTKKIVVLCDGTWCGKPTETEIKTNIKILAECIADDNGLDSMEGTFKNENSSVVGCYFEGIGLEGDFFDYIVNGAVALDIKKACLDVYKYIVEKFELGLRDEIWMF